MAMGPFETEAEAFEEASAPFRRKRGTYYYGWAANDWARLGPGWRVGTRDELERMQAENIRSAEGGVMRASRHRMLEQVPVELSAEVRARMKERRKIVSSFEGLIEERIALARKFQSDVLAITKKYEAADAKLAGKLTKLSEDGSEIGLWNFTISDPYDPYSIETELESTADGFEGDREYLSDLHDQADEADKDDREEYEAEQEAEAEDEEEEEENEDG